MKCPHCNADVRAVKTLNLSKWKNYICQSCGKESNFTSGYILFVYLFSSILTLATKYALSAKEIKCEWYLSLVIVFLYIIIIVHFTGRLVSSHKDT
jgi:protein-arginine kinase activator protein McsA